MNKKKKIYIFKIGLNNQEKIIFGGQCLPENTMLNDLWIMNYSQI
jgi:hypothetical protein